jgi:hypothetical protein
MGDQIDLTVSDLEKKIREVDKETKVYLEVAISQTLTQLKASDPNLLKDSEKLVDEIYKRVGDKLLEVYHKTSKENREKQLTDKDYKVQTSHILSTLGLDRTLIKAYLTQKGGLNDAFISAFSSTIADNFVKSFKQQIGEYVRSLIETKKNFKESVINYIGQSFSKGGEVNYDMLQKLSSPELANLFIAGLEIDNATKEQYLQVGWKIMKPKNYK